MVDESTLSLEDHADLDEDELEEAIQRRRERLRSALDEHEADISAETADHLARLTRGLAETETVEVNGQPMRVRAWTSAAVEDRLDHIADANSLSEVRQDIVDMLVWFIEDADYGYLREAEEPTRSAQKDNAHVLWQTFADEYGTANLFDVFQQVTDPAIERIHDSGDVEKFRS